MSIERHNIDDDAELHVILLLDERSQRRLQTSITDLASHDIKIIYSFDELTESLVKNYNTVVLLEDYFIQDNSISNLRLYKEVFNLRYIYIGGVEIYLSQMKDIADCYRLVLEDLTYQQIASCVLMDEGAVTKYEIDESILEDSLIQLKDRLINDGAFTEDVGLLYDTALALVKNQAIKDRDMRNIKNKCDKFERESIANTDLVNRVYKELNRVMDAEYGRDKTILQYEVLLSKDIFKKISLVNYMNRPLVLYFKQYTKLNNFDLFIEALYNTLRLHREYRCKALKLYNSTDSIEVALQSEEYKIIRNSFKLSDIEGYDLLVKYGDYSKVLEILLKNKVKTDVLLVFDCKGANDRVLSGCDYYIDICQSIEDAKRLNLDTKLTIVNDSSAPLSWNVDVEKLEKLNSYDAAIYLSSQPLIQFILSSIGQGEIYE